VATIFNSTKPAKLLGLYKTIISDECNMAVIVNSIIKNHISQTLSFALRIKH